MRRILVLCLVGITRPAAAQLPAADDAFHRGDYRAARAAYEQVLTGDSLNVRALYRLALMDSWDGALDRALARLRLLRRLEPRDRDITVAHARVLSWAGKYPAAIALYDSLLDASPNRADALAGRARTVAWSGDLGRAEQLWRSALTAHPDDPEIQVGMAQTLLWRGQPALAEGYAARARQLAPEDRTARDVLDLIRAALAPEFATQADYSHDSDHNGVFTHRASYAVSLGAGRRGAVYGTWRRATDLLRAGGSYALGGRLTAPLGPQVVARVAFGGQLLAPDTGGSHVTMVPEIAFSVRPGRAMALSLAWRHSFFDETAVLLRNHLTTQALDFDMELSPLPRVNATIGAGTLWLTGNQRWSAVAAVMVAAAPGLEVGALIRSFGYETNPGLGYFAPDLFALVEGRGRYERRFGHWGVSADAGVGSQQVGKGAPGQTAWHARLGVSRRWNAANELSLSAGWSNSAASSATGAYRSWTAALQWRQGL
jgi:tetratricopeptide (TPR) repeat protein